MNCKICHKDVNEHGEGRETDRCVAEKLGLDVMMSDHYKIEGNDAFYPLPHYSSSTMSAEVWELVEKFNFGWYKYGFCGWETRTNFMHVFYFYTSKDTPAEFVYAPTATLSIIRAFLGVE